MHLESRSAHKKARPLTEWRFNSGYRFPTGEAKQDGVPELRAGAGGFTCLQAYAAGSCAQRGDKQNLVLDRLGAALHDGEVTRAATIVSVDDTPILERGNALSACVFVLRTNAKR
jgi:hypothetical protein